MQKPVQTSRSRVPGCGSHLTLRPVRPDWRKGPAPSRSGTAGAGRQNEGHIYLPSIPAAPPVLCSRSRNRDGGIYVRNHGPSCHESRSGLAYRICSNQRLFEADIGPDDHGATGPKRMPGRPEPACSSRFRAILRPAMDCHAFADPAFHLTDGDKYMRCSAMTQL